MYAQRKKRKSDYALIENMRDVCKALGDKEHTEQGLLGYFKRLIDISKKKPLELNFFSAYEASVGFRV